MPWSLQTTAQGEGAAAGEVQSKVEKTDSKTEKSNVTDGKVDGKAPDVIVESHNVRLQ